MLLRFMQFRLSLLGLIPLASCSLLFSPGAEPSATDAGGSDAPDTGPEWNFDFEDGLQGWERSGACALAPDPEDDGNQVICCESDGNATFALDVRTLGVDPTRHAEVGFRVLSVIGPSGDDADAWSPLAAATDQLNLQETVFSNMNLYPDNSVGLVSVPSGVPTAVGRIPNTFTADQWNQVKLTASTEVGCELSVEILSPKDVKSVGVVGPHERGDIGYLIFGIFRQRSDVGTVRRCFDDFEIRFPDSCTKP